MRSICLILFVALIFANPARSASIPIIFGEFHLDGEYTPVMNIVESPGERSGIVTQWGSYRNNENGTELSFKIGYLNNFKAVNYGYFPTGDFIEEAKIGVWKYRFYALKDQMQVGDGISVILNAAGYGKISITIATTDPAFKKNDLIQLIKNTPVDLDKALNVIHAAKPAIKKLRDTKDGVLSGIGLIPLAIKPARAYTYVKQIDLPGQFASTGGQRMAFRNGSMFNIDWQFNDTVLESFCGRLYTGNFDLDKFYEINKYVLFEDKFSPDSEKDFVGLDFRARIETGISSYSSFATRNSYRKYQASMIKIRKGEEVYLIRITSPTQIEEIEKALVEGLRKTKLECAPISFLPKQN